jgi:hypothetical protein
LQTAAARVESGGETMQAEPLNPQEPEGDEGLKPIPDRLMTELTARRTLALRHALGEQPDLAFLAALHALCIKVFYRYAVDTCLELDLKSVGFGAQAPASNTTGRSMFVRLKGPETGKGEAGKWTDAATGEHGDLLDVIRETCGLVGFKGVADEAHGFLSLPHPAYEPDCKPRPASAPAGSPEAARRLFAMSQPIIGTIVEEYLGRRGISVLHGTGSLRFHPRCYYQPDEYSSTEIWPCAGVVVEGATVRPFVAENTTMIVIGLILSVFGIGFLLSLLFTLAVYALPYFAGMAAGLAAYHSGAGIIGALLMGFVAGAVTLVAGQVIFAVVKPPVPRGAVALLFGAPAAIAGHHSTLVLAHIGVPLASWREVFAIVGAIFVGGMAFVRMAKMATPPVAGLMGTVAPTQPRMTAATR